MALDKFLDSKNGFLVNDACIIVDEVFLNNNNASLGRELIDFKGVGKIERDYVELVEKASLGRVLHFLKTEKVNDMNDDAACEELQDLWDEVEMARFDDLTWLEPHVKSKVTWRKKRW
ncbi:hypothetical protein S83_040202 [Arachis hypogaea]